MRTIRKNSGTEKLLRRRRLSQLKKWLAHLIGRDSPHLRRPPLIWLLGLIFVASPLGLAAQTMSIVEGTVFDAQRRAIVGAEITLSGPMLANSS
jgi:hypothetical protein